MNIAVKRKIKQTKNKHHNRLENFFFKEYKKVCVE